MTGPHLDSLIHSARVVVREIGYVAQHKQNDCPTAETQGYEYSRIMHAYDMACAHLTAIDPLGAAEFIQRTYGPSLRLEAR